jgi:hypothetical protein
MNSYKCFIDSLIEYIGCDILNNYRPTAKGLLHPVLKAAAFSIGLVLVMFIAGYYNETLGLDWVSGLVAFLGQYWAIISGFVLLISVWDYLFPFFRDKNFAKYMKPLVDSTGVVFGLWLVVEFVAALAYFIPDASAIQLLESFKEIFFIYFVWIFLLIIFVNYAKIMLDENR